MTSVLLLLASFSFAQSPEAAHAQAELNFFVPDFLSAPAPQPPALPSASPSPDPSVADPLKAMTDFLKGLSVTIDGREALTPLKGPAVYLRLAEVRNNYAHTSATFAMDGRKVTVGFGMSRGQEVYLSVLGEDGAPLQLVNIKGLLNGSKSVTVNGAAAEVSLSPNIFDKLSSKINLKGSSDGRSFKLKELISAVQAKGLALPLDGRTYNVFFMDEIREQDGLGATDASRQNVGFLLRDGSDFHFYIVPFEGVPADKISVYSLMDPTRLGLQTQESGAVLGLFPNP